MQRELPASATSRDDWLGRFEIGFSDDDLFKCLLSELDLCGKQCFPGTKSERYGKTGCQDEGYGTEYDKGEFCALLY